MTHRAFYNTLYFRVICGIIIGITIGFLFPQTAQALKPLGDAFIKLIKMMIAPIIFCTVVVGIAKMGHMRDVGRVGIKALVYFEVMSTVALVIGLIVVNVLQPGRASTPIRRRSIPRRSPATLPPPTPTPPKSSC